MFQFSGVPFQNKVRIIIHIFIAMICAKQARAVTVTRIVNAIEGDVIQLNFSYPCHSSEVTLRHGNSALFYHSAYPESMSLRENQMLTDHNEFESDECFIRLLFNPVLRNDEDTYILMSYVDDHISQEVTVIELRVDYPPGKAFCEWNEDSVSVQCSAPSGSLPGEIVCYQDGIKVPLLALPKEVDNKINQTITVKYSQPAFCCSVAITQYVDRCDCEDYKWDPYRNVTDPCPVTMLTTPPEYSTKNPASTPTPEVICKTDNDHRPNVSLHVVYSCPLAISAAIIIGLALKLYNRKPKNYQGVKRQPSQEECEAEL